MPIDCPIPLRRLTEQEFRKLDYEVMGHAFASQRELGRLCDEIIYQNDLAARLHAAGLKAQTRVPITIHHGGFRKLYYLDIITENALIYELKTVTSFIGDHQGQLLNYLLALGLPTGKLLNFRPSSVEHQTVNAVLSHGEQRRFELITARWLERTDRDQCLIGTLIELLKDWGAFLEKSLYLAGLVHFLGGEADVISDVPLIRSGIKLGTKRLPLLDGQTGLHVTAFSDEPDGLEPHLRRFLALTPLQFLHWINFRHHQIELVTLKR